MTVLLNRPPFRFHANLPECDEGVQKPPTVWTAVVEEEGRALEPRLHTIYRTIGRLWGKPQIIFTIPSTEILDTLFLGTLNPSGISPLCRQSTRNRPTPPAGAVVVGPTVSSSFPWSCVVERILSTRPACESFQTSGALI